MFLKYAFKITSEKLMNYKVKMLGDVPDSGQVLSWSESTSNNKRIKQSRFTHQPMQV